ncbi:serine hydrolase [Amphiplicatus metriothermophilus]|uniref:CubicO group peptidase, beta-lactamase class C family n=1 Tax=Amphiplicatus metriothermophilus TaxID=1519374 RepID=A0A239PW03_9PROT|nr:serine hydrolase [Amphiplicatus metriothermophilus]MBB5518922.1 CubicO group peptidase (beta-lactamase class C family) [Amphiplicatus metriothermophilus]SNT74481.1 CubicO group peptidase, beta-lactamase class C family [Amphiplicatus metriothermophilus]
MSGRRIAPMAVLFALWAGAVCAADITPEKIEAYTARANEAFKVTGLAVTVVDSDSIIFQETYGVRDVRTGAPVDENTIFPFASIGKAFTTASLAMLVDEGKLGWDDPVRKYIPEFEMSDPYITAEFSVRDLVTHRSGLPLGAGDLLVIPDAKPEVSDILAAIKHIPPATSFRSEYAYDNLMYMIAGEVLSRIDRRPWHKSIEARLFKPLGMRSCEALPSKAAASKRTVTQHLRTPGSWDAKPIDPRYIVGDNTSPAGGISCPIEDLSKWAQFWLNDGKTPSGERLITEEQVKELWTGVTPQNVNPMLSQLGNTHFSLYGLGWTLRDFHGKLLVGHSGGLLGASAYFGLLPEEDVAVFVTSNVSTPGASALALQILNEAAAPGSDSDWIGVLSEYYARVQATAQKDAGLGEGAGDVAIEPVRPLKDYVGVYVDPWYGPVSIEIRDDALFIDMSRSEVLDAPLIPVEPDKFVARWPDRSLNADAYVIFSTEDGDIVGMEMEAVSETTDFSFDFHDLKFVRRR